MIGKQGVSETLKVNKKYSDAAASLAQSCAPARLRSWSEKDATRESRRKASILLWRSTRLRKQPIVAVEATRSGEGKLDLERIHAI